MDFDISQPAMATAKNKDKKIRAINIRWAMNEDKKIWAIKQALVLSNTDIQQDRQLPKQYVKSICPPMGTRHKTSPQRIEAQETFESKIKHYHVKLIKAIEEQFLSSQEHKKLIMEA